MIKTTFPKLLFVLMVSGPFSLASPAKAEAPITPQKPSASAAVSVAGVGKARFDWLAKTGNRMADRNRVVQKASLGNGSWICSPAGFNRKSHCFRR
ncbi:hypothetical protein AB2B41_12415 [Marimonas sp. MJW-29]|uniref:Uncharacterized protein n=1 Tax=Sulfitobacter sediminis TaxID=3234186 RepID=A0ABV3RNE7_9RHOB